MPNNKRLWLEVNTEINNYKHYEGIITLAVIIIKKLQWEAHSIMDGRHYCPICKGYKPSHKKNCIVAAFIRENK